MTPEALNILDCFSGADGGGRFVLFMSLYNEMIKRAAAGDAAAQEIVEVQPHDRHRVSTRHARAERQHMIVNSSYFSDVFLSQISSRLTPGDGGFWKVDSTDDVSGHEFIYFGGGYWRGVFCPDGMLSLINPDRTRDEIATIEAGIAALMRCGFRRERFNMAACPDCKHGEG